MLELKRNAVVMTRLQDVFRDDDPWALLHDDMLRTSIECAQTGKQVAAEESLKTSRVAVVLLSLLSSLIGACEATNMPDETLTMRYREIPRCTLASGA